MTKTSVPCKCPFCSKEYSIEVPTDEYFAGLKARRSGALIQAAFPTFTPEIREAIKTGICQECWDSM